MSRRPIVPKQPLHLAGGQPKNLKEKSTPGGTAVSEASSSMPKRGAVSQSRESAENSLMDDIGKAIENLKKKMGVTEGIKAKMDRAFKTLLEGISQGSSKDVLDAITSLEAISGAHHDVDLIRLLKTMKERTGSSAEKRISGGQVMSSEDKTFMDKLHQELLSLTNTLSAKHYGLMGSLPDGLTQKHESLLTLVSDLSVLSSSITNQLSLKSQTAGINSRVAMDKLLNESVNVWLVTLKNDIKTGSCTLLLKEDTPKELKNTRDLLQEITKILKENHLRQTRENNSLIEEIENLNKDIAMLTSSKPSTWKDGDMHWQRIKILGQKLKQLKGQPPRSVNEDRRKFETLSSKLADQEKKIQVIWAQLEQKSTTEDHLTMLNDIDKYLKENKRSIKTKSEERTKDETLSSKLADQEKKIQDIWTQFSDDEEQTPRTRTEDHLAMLNDIEKYLKENKSSIEKLQANEKLLREQIEQFQKEIEASDTDGKLQDIKETGKEIELVKKVIPIRKQVRGKLENRIKEDGANSQRTQEQVVGVWNLLFDRDRNDPDNDVSRKDVNALLESIHEELNGLEKTVFHVEECCYNMYQSLFGTKLPQQDMKTLKSTLTDTAEVLTACKDEAESIKKCFTQLNSVLDEKMEGKLSSQCEGMKSTIGRRFVARVPVVNNLLKMYNRTMRQKYIPSHAPNAETGRSQRKEWDVLDGTADDVIAVVVDICDQVSTKYESLQNNLAKCEHEKAELLTRLSKLAGANLTNNNPNIADLSDPYRPTKLGEMYSELYDNAWTDAFEVLDKIIKSDKEQTSIQLLLEILSESYKTCEDVSMRQQEAIMAALTAPMGPETAPKDNSSKKYQPSALQSKAVTELRKLSADTCVPSVQLFFEENCLKKRGSKSKRSIWFDKEPVRKYTMKCIELCWFMHIQAPPVHIDLTGQPDDKFDTNKFKQYTKTGNKIDFVVWPPLLLHEQGPLLSKGVAQGK